MLNCKIMSKIMKNVKFFVTSQQKTSKRTIREDAFTKTILIDVCGCLKKRHLIILTIISTYFAITNTSKNRSN
jgi:hypothetical protein